MKKLHIGIIVFVIIIGIALGSKINSTETASPLKSQQINQKKDLYNDFRSDGRHTEEEKVIKGAVDKYMFENFGSTFKTMWFDSVSASSVVINEHGRFFLVQSKADYKEAKKYVEGLLSFFNSKTTDKEYIVEKIILVDKEYKIIYQVDTIKW